MCKQPIKPSPNIELNYKARYDLIALHWQKLRTMLPNKDSELLTIFTDLLPPHSSILDLGCGSGIPIAKSLSEQGHDIYGVDRSAKLLQQAKLNLPNAQFIQEELETFDYRAFAKNHKIGGVVLWDSLFHIPRKLQANLLLTIATTMSSGTVLILTSGGLENEHPAFTDTMFEVEFYYDAFPINELIDRCRLYNLKLINKSMLNMPDGKQDKGRVGLIFQKMPA